jgi:polyisoprenoid-binding protein YceI
VKLFGLILAFSGLLWGNQISIYVSLNPAGSFVAKSSQLKSGKLAREGETNFKLSEARLSLNSLQSGIELRDTHMKDKYFEVHKYPEAELFQAVGKNEKFTAQLKVHGVTKEINGTYELKPNALRATFYCRLSDFKIKEAQYRGIGVEDQVKVVTEIGLP